MKTTLAVLALFASAQSVLAAGPECRAIRKHERAAACYDAASCAKNREARGRRAKCFASSHTKTPTSMKMPDDRQQAEKYLFSWLLKLAIASAFSARRRKRIVNGPGIGGPTLRLLFSRPHQRAARRSWICDDQESTPRSRGDRRGSRYQGAGPLANPAPPQQITVSAAPRPPAPAIASRPSVHRSSFPCPSRLRWKSGSGTRHRCGHSKPRRCSPADASICG